MRQQGGAGPHRPFKRTGHCSKNILCRANPTRTMLDNTVRDRVRKLLVPALRSEVPPFMVMDVMAAAARIEAAGGHVIHLEVGQPAEPAPRTAIAAAHAALDKVRIDYTAALGIPSLRARIARHYREAHGC